MKEMEKPMHKFRAPAIALLFAAAMILGACSHHRAATEDSSGVASGEIRPADTNAMAPAGPAVVDSTGRVYTSSNAPGSGNASSAGTNTNVSVTPQGSTSSVSVTETTPVTTAETTTTTTTVTTPEPMVSSTQTSDTTATTETTTTTTHKRMHKE
jgi:hypothetical protein